MNLLKRGALTAFVLSLVLFITSCGGGGGGGLTAMQVWKQILWVGKLGFLGITGENALTGFMRLMIFILVFAIFFELANLTGFLNRNIAIVIALIISIISAVFMPGAVLIGIGSTYSTLVALVLIGAPVLAGFYALYRIPATGAGLVARIIILLILLWILLAVKAYAAPLVPGGAGIGPVLGP
tara:strand:- start:903 stop:1451 length:549 start_codon:yes stop_codon:yes gene_type:complete